MPKFGQTTLTHVCFLEFQDLAGRPDFPAFSLLDKKNTASISVIFNTLLILEF